MQRPMMMTCFGFVLASLLAAVAWRSSSGFVTDAWRVELDQRAADGDFDGLLDLEPDDSPFVRQATESSLLAGPLVSSVTTEEALVWIAVDRAREATIEVTGPEGLLPKMSFDLIEGRPRIGTSRLRGLKAGTSYRYRISVDGWHSADWTGHFRTAPAGASRFKMAVSSCMDALADPVQPLWYVLLGEQPDFQLLLGDNTYANSTDPALHWTCHRRQRQIESFAAALRRVPTYAVWDDHDYGPNDSDSTAPGKERALDMFRRLFPNPGAGSSAVDGSWNPGVYFRFLHGDVEFFMLDLRYHRSPNGNRDDARKTMLGSVQFEWLTRSLAESKARFKVIASPSTLEDNASDSWSLFTEERNRLFDSLKRHRVGGVIWLSGDTHFSAVRTWPAGVHLDYPLVEVISSGIGQKEEGHPLKRHPRDSAPFPPIDPVPVYRQAFAVLEFDTQATAPWCEIRIIRSGAVEVFNRRIHLAELAPPVQRP